MKFHYHYPHYYLPLERNQDARRMGGKNPPLDQSVGIPLELILSLPLNPTVVIPQDRAELIPM